MWMFLFFQMWMFLGIKEEKHGFPDVDVPLPSSVLDKVDVN
jgi:hypothetical protein